MSCPEKEILQNNCTASWSAFEGALESLEVKLDPKIGPAVLRLVNGLTAVAGLTDPRTGTLKSPYVDALGLLREHQRASSLLSKHLHTHRC